MSTIKSSSEHLTLNADGASKDIKFQANGVEKASISSAGAFTSTTIDATALTGALPAIDGSNLTGTADATKLPLAGGTMTGNLLLETSGNPSITNKTTGSGNNPTFRLQADTHYWDFQGTFSNANDELMFMYDGSSKLTIDNDGIVDTQYKIKEHNGTRTHTERFFIGGNAATTWDITVPSEGGNGNSFLVHCSFNHYHNTGYGAHLSAWYSARTTSCSQVALLGSQSSVNGGSWSVSKPSSTTLRITKNAGSYSGQGAGFIQVTWSATV